MSPYAVANRQPATHMVVRIWREKSGWFARLVERRQVVYTGTETECNRVLYAYQRGDLADHDKCTYEVKPIVP